MGRVGVSGTLSRSLRSNGNEVIMSRRFDATSTTDEVLEGTDLREMRVLVTGVSAGLGVETARALARRGARVAGAARDLAKAERATAQVRADAEVGVGGGSLELVELDLASLASIRACTAALTARDEPFDLVIANAGVMATPFGHTADGFETQFGTNHLGHFLLVNRIAPLMRPGARLVSLSSSGHRYGDVDLDDPNFERTPYEPFVGYGRSKTANILFAVEFDRRHRSRGVRATAVHPGGIQTELGRHLDPAWIPGMIDQMNRDLAAEGKPPFQFKTIPQGAATSVWAGVVAAADEVGGRYCENCHVGVIVPDDRKISAISEGVRGYALDAERAEALWAKSEEMVGERF
jgi:NAD(P)-dependent dehydrogenase (short-subunit alcohol dehydrogenase family)